MGNFQGGGNRGGSGGGFRGGSGGGRPNFQKKSWGNDRGGDRNITMHKTVCNECGNSCEVPFRPSGDKPVYCNDCFGSKRDDAPRKDFSRNDRPAPRGDFSRPVNNSSDDVSKRLGEISVKLDRLAVVIEKMMNSKNTEEAPKTTNASPDKKTDRPSIVSVVKKAIASSVPAKKTSSKKTVTKKAVKGKK